MLDAADRLLAYAKAQGLAMPQGAAWGFLDGFRRADQDVDRTPSKWIEEWSAVSRKSLENAQLLRAQSIPGPEIDFSEMPGHAMAKVERFIQDAFGGLDKQLASSLIDAREGGFQAWIRMEEADSLPHHAALLSSRRLGAAWWCQPPNDRQDWEQFCLTQEKWSSVILKSPEWDQWVWPWGCMIEQGLRLCAEGKRPSVSRFSPPEGWRDRRVAAWGGLGHRIWVSAMEAVPDGGWEDLWIGLVCVQAGVCGTLAHEKYHAINGAHKENDRV